MTASGISVLSFILLLFLNFLASFIDSIAGGGGLISLPAYMLVGLPSHTALGNNKFSASLGALVATARYGISRQIYWKMAGFAAIFSLVGSFIGSNLVLLVSDYYVKILLIVILPVIAFITYRDRGKNEEREMHVNYILLAFMTLLIGAYDGFFGPGTGMFLTLMFTSIFHVDMVHSCGNTKLINLTSNIAALITFIINGNIVYSIAVPCSIASIIGGYVGSGFAIRRGEKLIRKIIFLVIAILFVTLIAKL